MIPNHFSAANTHRIVQHTPDQKRPDIERLEDIAADAMAMTREALSLQDGLFTEAFNALHPHTQAIGAHLDRRHMLGEPCRRDLAACIAAADRLTAEYGDDSVLAAFTTMMREALDLLNRVADLIAAEQDVAYLRSLRTRNQ